MTFIYGVVTKRGRADPNCLEILKTDLARYPSDGHTVFRYENIEGGQFYQQLRKPPFPVEQPIRHTASGMVIFARARLDYRKELLRRLAISIDQHDLFSDSWLILEAYLKWGEACVKYLEGDFGFLIWNPDKQCLWGARDPIGFKPIFFSIHAEECYFSSHTKGLSRLPFVNRKPHEAFYQSRLMRLGTSSGFSTPFEGIQQIPVGYCVRIHGSSVVFDKYFEWKTVPTHKKISRNDYAEELNEILSEAVKTRLYEDYPIGGYLSGGLDSSTILGLADGLLKKQKNLITTSTVHHESSKDPKENEKPWVEAFKRHFPNTAINYSSFTGTPPFRPEDSEFFGAQKFRRYPMLFGEELMENTLMAKGCRTFLTGWRGDHFISRRGYSAYSELLKQGKFSKFIKAVWGTSEFLGRRPLRMLRSIAISNIPEKYLMSTEFPGVSLLNPGWVKESNLVERQGHNTRPTWGINDVNWDIIKRLPTYDGAHQYYEDLSFRHNQILIRLNPLSDPRVINFTLKLPAEEFVKEGMDRSIMRRAIKNIVPDELRLRRTKGSFMGDESEICSRLHYEWLRRIDVPKLIDHTPFAPFINVDALLKQLKIHKDKLEKGNYVFDHEGTYFLNLLGYFLYFENS